jgi:hypothetical protein
MFSHFPYRDTLKLMSQCGKTSITRNMKCYKSGFIYVTFLFIWPTYKHRPKQFFSEKNHRKRWQYIYFLILISIIFCCSKNIKLYIIHAITILKNNLNPASNHPVSLINVKHNRLYSHITLAAKNHPVLSVVIRVLCTTHE